MFCRNCGAEIADGVNFCESCGTKVEQPGAAATSPIGNTVAGAATGDFQAPAAQPFNAHNVAQNIGAGTPPTNVPPTNVPPTNIPPTNIPPTNAAAAAGTAPTGGGKKGLPIGIIAAVIVVIVVVFGAFSCGGGSSSSSSSASSASSESAASTTSTTSSASASSASASSASSSSSSMTASMQTVGNSKSGYITVPSSWVDTTGDYDSNIVDSTAMVCYADPSTAYSSAAFGHSMYSDAIQLRSYPTSYTDIAKQAMSSYGNDTYSTPDYEETTFNGNKCYIITTSVPKDNLYLCNIALDRDGTGNSTVLFTIQGKESTIQDVLGYASSWSKTK